MGRPLILSVLVVVLISGTVLAAGLSTARAEHENAQLLIKSFRGDAFYCDDGVHWLPLVPNVVLGGGAILRTGRSSTADLILNSSGTALRMIPNSVLEVSRLEKEVAGEEVITSTVLDLRAGGVIASQRRLDQPSTFQIHTSAGTVTIGRSEYLVQADGTVRCFAGRISVDGDFVAAATELPAGFSFDPISKTVAPMQANFFTIVAADLETVRQNASSVKKDPGHAVINRVDKDKTSTTKGGNNGVGNGPDPQPPGNPPVNDGPGTGPGNPGNKGGTPGHNN
jgi:hypothetical protein